MHEIQIDIIQSQVAEAFATSGFNTGRIVQMICQLCNDENFFALEFARRDRLVDGPTDFCLVLISVSGVDVTIAGIKCDFYGLVTFVI